MDANELSRRWLPRLLCAALAVRLVAALGLQWTLDEHFHRRFLIEGDAEGYWHLAGDIARGDAYAIYQPPRQVLRMPGFPLILALPRALFGDRLLPARLLLAFVGTAACWGVFRLGVELFDDRVGLLAGGLAAISPPLVVFTPVILSETAFAAALVWSLVAAARLLKQHRSDDPGGSALWAAATGIGFAAACYIRPSWLLAGPLAWLLLAALSRSRTRACWDGLVLNCVLLTALVPWGFRNQAATGHFVLTTLWMGPSLYDGLNPRATGDSEMSFFDRDNLLGRGMSEYEVNRHYRDLAWRFVRENPRRAVELAAIKLWRYWKPWPNAEQFSGFIAAVGVSVVYVPAMLLAGYAVWRRPDPMTLTLTLGPILYFAAIHAVFVSSLRYRLPGEYPLYVLSAAGFLQWRLRFGPSTVKEG